MHRRHPNDWRYAILVGHPYQCPKRDQVNYPKSPPGLLRAALTSANVPPNRQIYLSAYQTDNTPNYAALRYLRDLVALYGYRAVAVGPIAREAVDRAGIPARYVEAPPDRRYPKRIKEWALHLVGVLDPLPVKEAARVTAT